MSYRNEPIATVPFGNLASCLSTYDNPSSIRGTSRGMTVADAQPWYAEPPKRHLVPRTFPILGGLVARIEKKETQRAFRRIKRMEEKMAR